MTLDVVNAENERVGALDVSDELVGGPARLDLVWESVVRANASRRRGTHATKNRSAVSGSGRKPWRQKGTGRARVGEIRNPLWRKGGTVFGPTPRSYDYRLPRKVEKSALREAFAQKLRDGAVVVIDALPAEAKTKAAAELLARLGTRGRTLVTDLKPGDFARAARNLSGVAVVASRNLTARDVMVARRVIATRAAVERLEQVLAAGGQS